MLSRKIPDLRGGIEVRALSRTRKEVAFLSRYARFLRTGRTRGLDDLLEMRSAYIQTNGRALQHARGVFKVGAPRSHITAGKLNGRPASSDSQLFPESTTSCEVEAVEQLRERGYWVFPDALSADWVDTVAGALRNSPVTSQADGAEPTRLARAPLDDPHHPTYWCDEAELLKIPEYQQLMVDPFVLRVVAQYLGANPVMTLATAWFSLPYETIDSASAQLFHFDMDRVRWVKLFVYLTDVTEETGPHSFLAGSHRSFTPGLTDNRLTEDVAFSLYSREDDIHFHGKRGTVFLEDTRGLHRGIPVKEDYRCAAEFEFATDLFGYQHDPVPRNILTEETKRVAQSWPGLLRRFGKPKH